MTKSNNKVGISAALAMLALTPATNGFVVPSGQTKLNPIQTNGFYNKKAAFTTNLSMAEDSVEELRAAAAKMREEANLLAKDMGKEIVETSKSTATIATPVKTKTEAEILEITSKLDYTSGNASTQAKQFDDLVTSGDLSLWKSASSPTSTALRTFPVTLNFLESRSDGKITAKALGVGGEDDVSLDDFKMSLLYVTIASSIGAVISLVVGGNIGSTLCYLFALIPIVFVGIGSSAPGIIAAGIQATRGSGDDESTRNDRICRHEAGHFLCGYLCGLPVKNYEITETGFPCVEFHPSTDMSAVSAQRELSREEIAAMSVVALSGSVAEALKYEEAKGGQNDLIELEGLFGRSKEFIGAAKQQDLTRWGALAAYQLIKANMEKYEKLVQAFKEKKSVAECIAVVEGN